MNKSRLHSDSTGPFGVSWQHDRSMLFHNMYSFTGVIGNCRTLLHFLSNPHPADATRSPSLWNAHYLLQSSSGLSLLPIPFSVYITQIMESTTTSLTICMWLKHRTNTGCWRNLGNGTIWNISWNESDKGRNSTCSALLVKKTIAHLSTDLVHHTSKWLLTCNFKELVTC